MTLQEIKAAVDAGTPVFWKNRAYTVTKDNRGQYFIKCSLNGHFIGLDYADGSGMNGAEDEFFTEAR